jgi:FkbM family methyltransferase
MIKKAMLNDILLYGFKKNIPGFGFASKVFCKQGFITENKFGVTLALNPYEYIDAEVLTSGYFDETVLAALLKYLVPDSIYWDLGANIGLHSFTIKKLLPTVECHCFEPFYSNFQKLTTTQLLNPSLSIQKYNFGLSDTTSVKEIYTTPGNHGRSGFHQLTRTHATQVHVLATSGDELISQGLAIPNVIKIDTEGHELSILKGCQSILHSDNLKAIAFEAIADAEEIISFLKKFCFETSTLDDKENFIAVRS